MIFGKTKKKNKQDDLRITVNPFNDYRIEKRVRRSDAFDSVDFWEPLDLMTYDNILDAKRAIERELEDRKRSQFKPIEE